MATKRKPSALTTAVKERAAGWGADLVGIADLKRLKGLPVTPVDLTGPFTRALSIAVALPAAVFDQIQDRPTPLYLAVYQTANRLLDEIAFRTASFLQKDGYQSLPIPASQLLDKTNWCGALSHKAVGLAAGLGWQGKNLLLINPHYGSRIRLATVLTDAPLLNDSPAKNRCRTCDRCREACPAGAIKGVNTAYHYDSREDAMHFSRCVNKVVGEFAAMPEIGVPICGVCIKVCPFSCKSSESSRARIKKTTK
jgi:epoxyqueuosine reductase QueG